MMTVVRLLAGVLFLWASPGWAWNSLGHMESAAVAWQQLTPKAKKEVSRLLKLNPQYSTWTKGVAAEKREEIAFVKAATWPDEIKTLSGYQNDGDRNGDVAPHTPEASQNIGYVDHFRHRYWHFIDEPFSTDGTPVQQPVPPNAQTQIAAFRKTLGDTNVSDDIQSYDLSWLLHLVGDVHQPLHATSRFTKTEPNGDAGGNLVKTSCETPCDGARELHAFWDDLLGDTSAAPQEAIDAASQLAPADAKEAAAMDENDWIMESFAISKEHVYTAPVGDTDGPFKLSNAYETSSAKIAKERIALAGARIANLLNEAFK